MNKNFNRTLIFLFGFSFVFNIANAQLQRWTRMESMPVDASPRNHPVTFALNGYGYVATGNTIVNSLFFNDVWRYDPSANSWQKMKDFPGLNRGYAYGLAYEGKAYLGFGLNPGAGFLKDLWEYDAVKDSWTQLPECPCEGRAHPSMLALDGKIYITAGGGASGDLKDHWEYDIQSQKWTRKADFLGPKRHHPFYFELGKYAYVGFGHSGPNIYKDLYRYDPLLDEWLAVASLPDQGRVAGTQFSYNGRGYILSGQGEDHQNFRTGEFWEYNPEFNRWEMLRAHPGSGRWAPGSFVIQDKVYLTCGTPDEGDVNDLWMYDFSLVSSEDPQIQEDLQFYPNPASRYLNFNVDLPQALEILDWTGRIMPLRRIHQRQIDLSDFAPGIYSVRQPGVDRLQTLIVLPFRG